MKDWNELTIDELLDAGVTPERIGSYAAEYYATVKQKEAKIEHAREAAERALREYLELAGYIKPNKRSAEESLASWVAKL